jgi:hypothetical protein
MATGLEIFSRQPPGDPRYQFPPPFDARVVGTLDYRRMLSAYRAYKVFLNVNTVVDSPSMCARRVFEITACGTPVVSTPSEAIDRAFDQLEVRQVATERDAELVIRALVRSPELRDRMVHRGQRVIWAKHTYGHRVDVILDSVGAALPRVGARPSVSVLVSSNRPHRLDHVLATVGAQRDVELELVLLTHGFEPPAGDLRARASECGVQNLTLLTADASVPLGGCLNRLVAQARGDLVAKLDDDDVYGEHYLTDQVAALGYSGAEVVGKQAHYMYLGGLDATLLRFAEREHRFTDFVAGPTIVTRRDVAAQVRFPEVGPGEDTGFLTAVVGRGGRVYAADRFNFLQVRDGTAAHTWAQSEAELAAAGTVIGFGRFDPHIFF